MKIAIFGSCVSRDTCEFIPDAEVVAYVARQSVTSLARPHGTRNFDFSALSSEFQRRMVTGDLKGNGAERITTKQDKLDLVLIDITDERRGFWIFPDGTTMTNSIEAELAGITRRVGDQGARLVHFGTDEHFRTWRCNYKKLMSALQHAGVWRKTVFIDTEWAGELEGSRTPMKYPLSAVAKVLRHMERRRRNVMRAILTKSPIGEIFKQIICVEETPREKLAKRARTANRQYKRYRRFARAEVNKSIIRTRKQLRIGKRHKWGAQPFHYGVEDYASIAQEIIQFHNRLNATAQ